MKEKISITCSQLPRLMECPQSYWLALEEKGIETEEAATGATVHAAMAGEEVELDEQQEYLKKSLEKQLQKFLKEVFGQYYGKFEFDVVENENRIRHPINDIEFSGKPDKVLIVGEEVIIVDYKTGEYIPARLNWQLKGYATLLKSSGRWFTLVIITPNGYDYCREDYTEVCAWEKLILSTIDLIKNKNAFFLAGAHCRFCPASYKCPEFLKDVKRQEDNIKELNKVKEGDLPAQIERVVEIYKKMETVAKAFPLVKEKIRLLLKENKYPALNQYFELGKPRELTKLNVPVECLLLDGLINNDDLPKISDVRITALLKLLAEKEGRKEDDIKQELLNKGFLIKKLTAEELKLKKI